MTVSQKKRQKKLAKKKAKRKATKAVKKSAGMLGGAFSQGKHMALAVNSPIHECFCGAELFDHGMGTVVFSRKIPNGTIGMGVFLLDVYCLGVKNAFFAMLNSNEFETKIKHISARENLESIHPTCARKVIEGCADYGRTLGFKPHRDFALARKIFGDADPGVCPNTYEYGKDGKPFYISGPNESSAKVKKNIAKLTKKLGKDGFHFMTPMSPDDGF